MAEHPRIQAARALVSAAEAMLTAAERRGDRDDITLAKGAVKAALKKLDEAIARHG
jgi:hypothetical protein